jgi:hypothetical protein
LILYWTSHNLAMKPEKVKVDPPALQHTHREEDLTTFEWGEVDRFISRKMLLGGWTRFIWTLSFLISVTLLLWVGRTLLVLILTEILSGFYKI